MTTSRPTQTQVAIIIDIHDETLLTVLLWARQSAHQLTNQLYEHGVIAHVARIEIDNHQQPDP